MNRPNTTARSRASTLLKGVVLGIGIVLYLALQDYREIDFFRDTDDHLRVAWLTWNLAEGHMPPIAQFPRDGGLGGLVVHWTMPWNLILVALLAVPAAHVGWLEAFRIAAPLIGPLLLTVVGAAAAWAIAPLVSRQGRVVAAAVAVSSPVVLGYGLPGGLDHHLAGIALALVGGGACVRAAARLSGGWAVAGGAVLAAAVWTAADALPLCVVFAGALLLLEKGCQRKGLAAAVATAALAASCAAIVIDPPAGGFGVVDPYRMSVFHASVWAVVLVAAVVPDLAIWRAHPLLAAIAAGAVATVVWMVLLRSGLVSVIVIDFPADLLSRIAEMRPADTVDRALRVLLPVAPPATGAVWMAWRARSQEARWGWTAAALSLLCLAGLSIWHVRFGAHSQAAAAAVMGVVYPKLQVVSRLGRRLNGKRIAAVLRTAPSIAVGVIASAHVVPMIPTWPPPVAAEGAAEAKGDCVVGRVAERLDAALPTGTIVMTDINLAPRLLTLTAMRSFAGPYHGYPGRTPDRLLEILGNRDGTGSRNLLKLLKQEGIGAILVCPRAMKGMPRVSEGAFGWALATGNTPEWLKAVELGGTGSALRLYRVLQ